MQFGRMEIESVEVVQRVAPYDISLVVSEGIERGPLDFTWQVSSALSVLVVWRQATYSPGRSCGIVVSSFVFSLHAVQHRPV